MKLASNISALIIGCSALYSLSAGINEAKENTSKVDQSPLGSYGNPIILDSKGIKNLNMLKYEQDEYIRKNYEDYRSIGEMFTMHGDRFIQIISLTNDEGEVKMVYFDMTEAYQKLSSKNSKSRKEIEELKNSHKPKSKEELSKILEKRKNKNKR